MKGKKGMEKNYRITFSNGPTGDKSKNVDVYAKNSEEAFAQAFDMPEAKSGIYTNVGVEKIEKGPKVIGLEIECEDTVFNDKFTDCLFIRANSEEEAICYYDKHLKGGRFVFHAEKTDDTGNRVRGRVKSTYFAGSSGYNFDATVKEENLESVDDGFDRLQNLYIDLMNAQLDSKHALVIYFKKNIEKEFGVALGYNMTNETYFMKTGKDIETKSLSSASGMSIKYFTNNEKEKYSISWPDTCPVNNMVEDVIRALQILKGIKIKDVYNTPTLIEKIKESIEHKYEAFTFSEDREGKTISYFNSEYEAKEFCFENGWSYKDKHGYVWALNYRDVLVKAETVLAEKTDSQPKFNPTDSCGFKGTYIQDPNKGFRYPKNDTPEL